MKITPVIIGRGRAGLAIAKSLALLNLQESDFEIMPPKWVGRGASLDISDVDRKQSVLCIANPHGLHAEAIMAGDRVGYAAILCEKPACVGREQIGRLKDVRTPTAVLHVYRQMWGPQMLKRMLSNGEFGEIITIEGRYWQASTAERALSAKSDVSKSNWKNDVQLSGQSDAFLDVGTHWLDTVSFLFGEVPSNIQGWRSFVNSEAPHRDSHVQLSIEYPSGGRAFGSISKTFHGATNRFEVNVIGSKKSATWEFLNPDEILIGEGRDRRVFSRKDTELGTKQSPYHGVGWLEGYVETANRLIKAVFLEKQSEFPLLKDNLCLLSAMFETEWNSK